MFDVDWFGLLTREVLRERTPALVAEACAWAVGLSDLLPPAHRTRSFQTALAVLEAGGGAQAERFDGELLAPFVLETCLAAAVRARADRPTDWAELADDVGEDPADPPSVVRAGGWEAPLRTDAEHLVLAALGALPLIEVEAEGLPLSLVRAAEAVTRGAAPPPPEPAADDDLAAVLFLAEAALENAPLPRPVRPAAAGTLLGALRAEGLDDAEVLAALPRLPVDAATADRVRHLVETEG